MFDIFLAIIICSVAILVFGTVLKLFLGLFLLIVSGFNENMFEWETEGTKVRSRRPDRYSL